MKTRVQIQLIYSRFVNWTFYRLFVGQTRNSTSVATLDERISNRPPAFSVKALKTAIILRACSDTARMCAPYIVPLDSSVMPKCLRKVQRSQSDSAAATETLATRGVTWTLQLPSYRQRVVSQSHLCEQSRGSSHHCSPLRFPYEPPLRFIINESDTGRFLGSGRR